MVEEYSDERHSKRRAKPNLLMRLAAGTWFGLAFGGLALGYLRNMSSSDWNLHEALISPGGLYLIILPTLVAGLGGFFFGGGILASSGRYSIFVALLRGTALGLISVTLCVFAMALGGTLGSRREFMQFVWLMIYIGVFFGLYASIVFGIYGAAAGFLLYWIGRLVASASKETK